LPFATAATVKVGAGFPTRPLPPSPPLAAPGESSVAAPHPIAAAQVITATPESTVRVFIALLFSGQRRGVHGAASKVISP
jgi:hypothetical protein